MCLGLSRCDGPFFVALNIPRRNYKAGVGLRVPRYSCKLGWILVLRHACKTVGGLRAVCKVVRCRVCADGSFACAGFALLRGPLVASRFAALGPVSGNAASMLIRTSARTSSEQSLQGCCGQSPEQSLQYRPSSRNYNQKGRRNATAEGGYERGG